MTEQDFRPLDTFISHYSDLKQDAWRSVEIESRPRALKRLLAIARQYGSGTNWSDQVQNYLEDFRISLAAARQQPLLCSRTTIWSVSSPAFVRRMVGSYKLVTPRSSDGDWSTVVWFRIPEPVAADLWLSARERNTTVARVVSEIVQLHFNS